MPRGVTANKRPGNISEIIETGRSIHSLNGRPSVVATYIQMQPAAAGRSCNV